MSGKKEGSGTKEAVILAIDKGRRERKDERYKNEKRYENGKGKIAEKQLMQ